MTKAVKKSILGLIAVSIIFSVAIVIGYNVQVNKNSSNWKPCLVTDFSDIDDGSFNEETYKGGKAYCDEHNLPWKYYKPSSSTYIERRKSVELAINRGNNILFLPGFSFAEVIYNNAERFPNIKFIGIDISMNDFPEGYVIPSNVALIRFREDIAGYFAGYATVYDGFREFGFLGGQEIDSVKRFGYGFIQGIDKASQELDINTYIKVVYAGQFYGDIDTNKCMDSWFKDANHKTECVFSCGGSIYTSAALAAKDNKGHVIGVDVDQKELIDSNYGDGICITSACKSLAYTVYYALDLITNNKPFSGSSVLGLIAGDDVEANFVGLPIDTWCMENFTIDDYKKLVKEVFEGKKIVSDETGKRVETSEHVEVKWCDPIK